MEKIVFIENDDIEDKFAKFLRIFKKGMSFGICLKKKLMPPLEIFNDFFKTGIDDISSEDVIHWYPVTWDHKSYTDLIDMLRKEGYDLKVDSDKTCANYNEWFTKQLN